MRILSSTSWAVQRDEAISLDSDTVYVEEFRCRFTLLRYAPFGLMCLIAGKIMSIENLANTAKSLGMYMLTVIVGLLFHACVTLSLTLFLITKRNPLKFFHGIFQAWITGLATASRSGKPHNNILFNSFGIL